jgi:uncharacterized repeat protein (TIGR02543 family)
MKEEDTCKSRLWQLWGCVVVALLMTLGALAFASYNGAISAVADEATSTPLDVQIKVAGDESGSASLEKSAYNSGESVVVQWTGAKAGNDFVIPTSITYDGSNQTINMSSLMELDLLQTQNAAYRKHMNEDATMTSYDSLSDYITSTHSVSLGAQTLSGTVTVNFTRVTPVYRMYNKITSEHLFTTNKTEYDNFATLLEQGQDYWIGEGIEWLAPTTGATVKRLYNAGLGSMSKSSHYYTSDETEIASLKTMGWVEDTETNWFLSGGTASIYTSYSEALGSAHLYTSSWDEWRSLDGGWDKEDAKNGMASDSASATGFFTCVTSMNWKYKDNFYQVQHKLNGTVFETQYLQGKDGDKTQAIALDFPGYKLSGEIEQKTIAGDSTIVEVNYVSNEYSITYNVNGKGIAPTASTYKYGDKITKPTDPGEVGFNFDGWYYDSACSKAVAWTTMPATNMTVFAHWSGKLSGTTGEEGEIVLYDAKAGKVVKTIIADTEGNPVKDATVSVDESTGNVSVQLPEAGDSKTVVVHLEDSDGEVAGREIELKDSAGEHKDTIKTTEDGATFKPNESSTDESGQGSFYDKTTESVVGIKVTDNADNVIAGVKVVVDDDGNLSATLPAGTNVEGIKLHLEGEQVKGKTVTLVGDTGVVITSGTTSETGDVELEIAENAGVVGDDGTVKITKPGSDEVYEISIETISGDKVPTGSTVLLSRTGNVKVILKDSSFDEEQFKIEVKLGEEAKSDVDVTLYKSDTTTKRGHGTTDSEGDLELKTFAVNFLESDDEGSAVVSQGKGYTGLTISKPNSDPTKSGYKFAKWMDKATDTEFDFTKEVTSEVSLYATWEPITYKIVFDAGEGTGTQESINATYDVKVEFPTCSLTAPDSKSFIGWQFGDKLYQAGTEAEIINLTTTDGAEVKLTAVWGNKTNANGEIKVTNPKDGKEYKVSIKEGSGDDSTPVADAYVNYTEDEIIVISPNETEDAKDFNIKVVKDEDQTPTAGETISVQTSDGETFSTGTTSETGEYTAHHYVYTGWTYDNAYDCHCTSSQSNVGTCSDCGDKVSETKEATGHTLVDYGLDSTAKLCTTCDHVIFGSYEQDANLDNGKEAIEWIKLGDVDETNGTQKLISLHALEAVAWNKTIANPSNIWADSNIRAFLSGKFYSNAFTSDEQSKIAETEIVTKKYQSDEVVGTTQDKVFLLSGNEAATLFSDNAARVCYPTAFALTTNTESGVALMPDETTHSVYWWTRSIGNDYWHTSHVLVNGDVSFTGTDVRYAWVGTRPAINLKLDTVEVAYFNGNNGLSDDGAAISDMNASTVVKGYSLTEPAIPEKEGYTFEGWYTDADLTIPFEFNEDGKSTTALSVDTKLYAKWSKTPASYFLASKSLVDGLDEAAMASISANTDATARARALTKAVEAASEGATDKVFVSGFDVKEDVTKMETEQAAGKTTTDGETLAKYKKYMDETEDPVLLYTTYGSTSTDWADATNTSGADANKYVEFRIIQVGQHQYDADTTHLDGTVLTLQATHTLPAAEFMGSGSTNTGGWISCDGTAVVYPKLQKDGDIYNRFPSTFTSEMRADTTKAFSIGGGTPSSPKTLISTSQDSFFLLSYSEIVGDATDYVTWLPAKDTEGAQYNFFAMQNIKGNDNNSCLEGISNTRAGALPINGHTGEWWLRSSYINIKHCMQLCSASGNPSDNNAMRWPCGQFGIAPAFCFGDSTKSQGGGEDQGQGGEDQGQSEETSAAYFLASKSLVDNLDETTMTTINAEKDTTKRAQALSKAVQAAAKTATDKVFISGENVKADVTQMKTEQAANKTTSDAGTKLAEYKVYMDADDVHLYTAYGSQVSDWQDVWNKDSGYEKNMYAEFRIIQVGQHQYDADATHLDGSVITFHATHTLPKAEAMATSDSNVGSWTSCNNTATLYKKLQKDGELYKLFPTSLTDDIKADTIKTSHNGGDGGSEYSTSKDSFFVLAYSEIVDGEYDDGYSPAKDTEGVTYDFFRNKVAATAPDDLTLSILKTRAGGTPANSGYNYWWLRSPDTYDSAGFRAVGSFVGPSHGDVASGSCGVAPAFCF